MYTSKIRSLLKKYGTNTISYQCLMDGFSYYQHPDVDGFIPYVKVKKAFFVSWDPICSLEDFDTLVLGFRDFCRGFKSYSVFVSCSLECMQKLEKLSFWCLKVGEEAVFHLWDFSLEGHNMKANRNYVRRADKEGITIRKLEKTDEELFPQIEDIATEWLKNRKTKELSFLLKLDVLDDIDNKYIFVAMLQYKVVACLSCVPIYGKNGWYMEDMIYLRNIPVGTTQLLVFEALQYMKNDGYTVASFGTSPLVWLEKEKRSKFWKTQAFQVFVYKYLNTFYNFKWLYSFKKSLCPDSWESKYYSFYPPRFTLRLFLTTIKLYYPKWVHGVILWRIQKLFFNRKLKKWKK